MDQPSAWAIVREMLDERTRLHIKLLERELAAMRSVLGIYPPSNVAAFEADFCAGDLCLEVVDAHRAA
jgi:hypothetical protein